MAGTTRVANNNIIIIRYYNNNNRLFRTKSEYRNCLELVPSLAPVFDLLLLLYTTRVVIRSTGQGGRGPDLARQGRAVVARFYVRRIMPRAWLPAVGAVSSRESIQRTYVGSIYIESPRNETRVVRR